MDDSIKKFMKKSIRTILKDEYDLLEDFFEIIIHDGADYIIFISRRCFVLYQLFAYINGWNRDNVISDRGVWAYRKQIRNAHRIIIADDVLVWGNAMQTAYTRLMSILGSEEKCEIKQVIYCRYEGCNNEDAAEIRFFSERSMRECRALTNMLLKSIMASGIPYTSFLYSFYGKSLNMEHPLGESVVRFHTVEATEQKWKSFYDFKIDERLQAMLDCLCDGGCIRYYYQAEMEYLCVIPFAFLSDIKNRYLTSFYHNIAECCKESGWLGIAEEIEAAESDNSNEKWQYLAMLISSLISRVIGVTEHIDQKFNGGYDREISRRSLEGIFPSHVFEQLECMDAAECLQFAGRVALKKEVWDTCLSGLPRAEGSGDQDECLRAMLDRFSGIRLNYEKSHDSNDKQIDCRKLYEEYYNNYSRDVILAAQIECYDAGIVTYGFRYGEADGSVSKCGIGEGSSVLFPLKYRNLIHQYYICNTEGEIQNGALNAARRRDNLNRVLQEAGLSEKEKELFWSFIQNDINNIYDYYLNE